MIYLKCLTALGKDRHSKLKYVKRHFCADLIQSSLILQYKFIKYEYELSSQLEDDYLVVDYSDISAFIEKFQEIKRIIKSIVKKKGIFYDSCPNKMNKIYNFFKAIAL